MYIVTEAVFPILKERLSLICRLDLSLATAGLGLGIDLGIPLSGSAGQIRLEPVIGCRFSESGSKLGIRLRFSW